jgi:glycopeptide antibiotics resistance protein
MRAEPFRARISLLPFFLGYGLTPALLVNIVLNVILTIPFGFGLNFLARLRPLSWIFLSLLVGGGIESTQLAISILLRYTYRVIDIHDAFANTLGVLLGYALFLLFALAVRLLLRVLPQPRSGLARYLEEVVVVIPR